MLALSSYNPALEATVRSGLNRVFPLSSQWEGIFVYTVFSSKGSFVRFQWADRPDDLQQEFAARVEQFQKDHDLQRVNAGSPEWNEIFGGSVADYEAASKVDEILGRHLGNQVKWVRSERDVRRKIEASVGLDQGQRIDISLSWKGCSVGAIGLVDVNALRGAVSELQEWAGRRIRPILDALKQKLQELYDDRFKGLYVFGSYARPDAGIELPADSDLDVALVLKDFENPFEERARLSDITADLSLEHDIVISLIPIREEDYREGKTNFTRVISKYAIPV